MKISQHIAVGVAGSLPVFLLTRSYETTITFFLSNSLIDIDHIIDYWYDYGFNLSRRRFLKACSHAGFTHFFVLLHSFEVLFVILLALFIFRNNSSCIPYILGIFLGFSTHLVSDIIYNKGIKLKYFFIFNRYARGFKLDNIGDRELLSEKRKER